MKEITGFQCDYCNHILLDKNKMIPHESDCHDLFEYEKEKKQKQKESTIYLDSFRGRVQSVSELLNLIEDEMDDIVKAIGIVRFYGKENQSEAINSFTFKRHGFASVAKPELMSMTHTAPVGKNKCPWYPNEAKVQAPAFEVEVFYQYLTHKGMHFNLLNEIGGINTGSGGNWSSGMHYYITLWMEDFPLGLK
jgi:hypothetical protein